MHELVEFLARSLVDMPDQVRVDEDWKGDYVVYRVHVAEDDMGKVIGKQGRIAQAIRALLKVSATKHDVRAVLEIGD